MEKAKAPHSSTLAWKMPWTEEPGRLQSMRSQRVRHDWVTSLSRFTFLHWRRKWQPTPVFLPGESQGWQSRAWWAAVRGVAQSQTWLERLSSSSSGQAKSWLIWKDPDAGKDWGHEEKGTTEDEVVGWHHRLNGHGWVWMDSGSRWWTGRPGMLWFTGSQSRTWLRDWTELICISRATFLQANRHFAKDNWQKQESGDGDQEC